MKKVRNTHCYQVNTPPAIIRYDGGEEDVVVDHTTADNCLTTYEKCFHKSRGHKTILSNFCLECIIGLLRLLVDDLNRMTYSCIVLTVGKK